MDLAPQLNQNMLLSMRHTSDALQMLGLKVTDADNIMLDLEESTGDINALQGMLSSGFDAELTQEDLDAELELVLSDDALCAYRRPARPAEPPAKAQEAPAGKRGYACTQPARAPWSRR